jgi:diguanylate cyclase (GGDEF)-like protein
MRPGTVDEVDHGLCCASCGQPLGYRTTDKLTGLLDRWGWDDEATRTLARSHRRPAVLLIVDLDRFKQVNDAHGHQAGDEVIRAVASAVRHDARQSDLVGRYGGYGGDEFLVLLPGTDARRGGMVARRLHTRIGETIVTTRSAEGRSVVIAGLTASVGVAAYDPTTGEDLTELIRRADAALLRAKRAGGNGIALAPAA